jgi:tRNA pseudouridine13 synthase
MQKLSTLKGSGGRIKSTADDFCVEEIQNGGVTLGIGIRHSSADLGLENPENGKFSTFIMEKRGWNTIQALRTIAKSLKHGFKSVGFAGTKDKVSVSTQLCSIFGARPAELMGLRIKDISINGAWNSVSGVKLGDLLGNRFTIRIRDLERPDVIDGIKAELNGAFPNYFGGQRFGARENNVSIGLSMMRGEFEDAVMSFLTETKNETNEAALQARTRLRDERDFWEAAKYFPSYLKYERLMLEYLSQYPTAYSDALRRLPRQLLMMFVHSVEAYIFNAELELRIINGETDAKENDRTCRADKFGFPDLSSIDKAGYVDGAKLFPVANIVGFESKTLTEYEVELLDRLGISKEMFRIKRMPELNVNGTFRVLFAPYLGFSSSVDGNDASLRFSLPAGSYATVLLDEFLAD